VIGEGDREARQNGNCAAVIIPRGQLRTLGWQRDEPLTIQVSAAC
jgi:antitoxin component of MazEF toxin-antitoxin module